MPRGVHPGVHLDQSSPDRSIVASCCATCKPPPIHAGADIALNSPKPMFDLDVGHGVLSDTAAGSRLGGRLLVIGPGGRLSRRIPSSQPHSCGWPVTYLAIGWWP